MGFHKEIVVDGSGHLMGRLAAVTAKQLLKGESVTVLRCEDVNISGSLFRNRMKFMNFLRKRCNTNPTKRSHIHYRTPSKFFWRVVRGMLPHKKYHGSQALQRLKVAEGVPEVYVKRRRLVVPSAMKCLKLQTHRDYCRLGDLCSRIGWKHNDLLKKMEETRKEESAKYWEEKQKTLESRV